MSRPRPSWTKTKEKGEVDSASAAQSEWGFYPILMLVPCVLIMFVAGLMTYELLRGMWGCHSRRPSRRAWSSAAWRDCSATRNCRSSRSLGARRASKGRRVIPCLHHAAPSIEVTSPCTSCTALELGARLLRGRLQLFQQLSFPAGSTHPSARIQRAEQPLGLARARCGRPPGCSS